MKEEANLAKKTTLEILKKRIESAFTETSFISRIFDETVVTITELPEKDTYSIVLNKKVDKNRLTRLLQGRSDFGFWETYNLPEIFEYLTGANTKLKEVLALQKGGYQKLFNREPDSIYKENPLFSILPPSVDSNGQLMTGSEVGYCKIADTAIVNKITNMPEIKALLPRNLKLLWEAKPHEQQQDMISLFAIKVSNRDGYPPLSNDCITSAIAEISEYGPYMISMKMNSEGARIWSRMTKENINRQIAMVFNNVVYSCPRVMSEINEGNSQISGNFTMEEASDLASMLNSGVMPHISVKVMDIH